MPHLKEQIEADKLRIAAAKESYLIALREYEAIKWPIEKAHRDILDKFMSAKNREIKAEHDCGCCRPRFWDEAGFSEDCIWLRMDADHPNDIHDADFSWSEVESVLGA